jgi:hypothetical protein
MRRGLVLRRRLAHVRGSLVLRRRLAHVRSSLVLHRRLAYVRSRLVLVRRRASHLSACLRRGMGCAVRHRGILRSRCILVRWRTRRGVVIVRRSARCATAVRSRPFLVHIGRRMRCGVVRARDVVGTVGVRCSSGMGIGRVCTFGRASDIVVGRL